MTCENLATKAELAALEQKLTAMLSAKLDKSREQAIIDFAIDGALTLAAIKLIPPVRAKAEAAASVAEVARTKAFNAGDIATRAMDVSTVARDVANGSAQVAKVAQTTANVAAGEARSASALARAAQGAANIAKGAADTAGNLARSALGKIDDVSRYFGGLYNALDGKLGGLLSKFGDLAGKVFHLLNVVSSILSIITTLATIYQLTDLTIRVGAIEKQMSLINSELDRIQNLALRILEQVRAVEKNLDAKASEALAKAIAAFNLGFNALSNSFRAQETAGKALKNSIDAAKNAAIASAVATAASLAVSSIASRIAGINSIANSANAKADEALRRAGKGGTTYIDRTVTRVEQRNFIERIEGKPGAPGKDGNPGRDGKDGKDMNPADTAEIKALLRRIDGTTTRTDLITGVILSDTTNTFNKVGKIEGVLNTLNNFTQKAFKATRMDKVLNALNTVLLFHNAAMLSRNLAVTLGDTASTVLNAFGVRDENDQPLDVNAVLGKKVTELAKTILGAEVYDDLSDKWKAASRILASASRMLDIMRSMIYSMINGLEVIGRWIALIGNGAQRDGVFSDGVFPWANENPNFKNPFFNYVEKLERLEDAASSINELASEVVEGKELIEEFRKEKKTFNEELDKGAKELSDKEEEEIKKSKNPDLIKDEDLSEAPEDEN